MKIKLNNIILGLIILCIMSCSEDNENLGRDTFQQKAILYSINGNSIKQAEISYIQSIEVPLKEINSVKEKKFAVSLAKENKQDIEVNLSLSPEEIKKYNEANNSSLIEFPAEYVEFTSKLSIPSGKVNSEEGLLRMTIFPEMKEDIPYMLAIKIESLTNGIEPLTESKTLLYTLERKQEDISVTVELTRNTYLAPISKGNFSDIGGTFTLEGFVYVDRFRGPGDMGDAGISTFMGTEGRTLLRFGDAGVPPNHLQANRQDIGVTFKEKTWYHIALVVDGNQTSAYVNGVKVTDYSNSGGLGDFFIGRSYNGNRGLSGRISEIRVWSKAQSTLEIKNNMYGVNESTPGLYAYWKMNTVEDNEIKDISGNERHLGMFGQANESGRQQLKTFKEKVSIKIK